MFFRLFFVFLFSLLQGEIIHISSLTEYEKEVQEGKKQVFVSFFMEGCPPCLLAEKFIIAWNRRIDDQVKVLRIDLKKTPALSHRFGVKAVPFFGMLDLQGELLLSKTGLNEVKRMLISYENSLGRASAILEEELDRF